MGCYGSTDLQTPHLDRLAQQGVRFTQFYAAAPICSASRAGILTGRYPARAGVPWNCASQPGGPGALPVEETTMAEMFKTAGYATALIGKWHLGYTPETRPNAQGFDYFFGHRGGCIDNWSHFFNWSGPARHDLFRNDREVFYDGQYFPDLMVREASEFIGQHRDRPFFIYFAINAPHYPYQAESKWLEHYRNLPYPRNLYAAFLSTMDDRIGALIGRLDELGLRERTIVVLQSDNGHSTEVRAHGGGGSAGPYRGAKFSLFEGGIRLPAIVSWPGRLPEGETRTQVGHACDWLPTLAELCGVKQPAEKLDGLSLANVLESATAPSPHKALHWYVGNPQEGPGSAVQWAVREGDWKLMGDVRDTTLGVRDPAQGISEPPAEPLFLANLANDIGERTNLAAKHPEIVARLRRIHEEMIAEYPPFAGARKPVPPPKLP